uniref:Uncharacterized protein n=1 Tax=Craspedostauros australis TaxID=1486917 RepID=A0A7R9ZNM6_9STRA
MLSSSHDQLSDHCHTVVCTHTHPFVSFVFMHPAHTSSIACGAVGAGHQMSGVNRGGGTTSYGNTGGYYYGYGSKCDACTGKHEPRIGTNCADSSSDNSCCTSRIWTFTKPHLAPKLAIAWLGTTLLQTALFIVVASRSDGRSSSCLQVWRIANAEV